MPTGQWNGVLRQIRRAALLQEDGELADGQLLDHFLAHHDETAFEALVRRHGPMVMGVCRRVLRNSHDAEDAFQATFLVLVRKAASVVPREMVGNWLYGVAYRTALGARTACARRRAKEREMPRREALDEDICRTSIAFRLCSAIWKAKVARKQPANWAGRKELCPGDWRERASCWRNDCLHAA